MVIPKYNNTFTITMKKGSKKIKKSNAKVGGSFKADEQVIIDARIKAILEGKKSLSNLIEEFLINYLKQ